MSKQADNQNNELNGMLYVQSNYLDEWEEAIDFHKELYNEALKYGEDGYLTNHIITRDKVFEQSGYIYCVVATVGFNKVFFVNKTTNRVRELILIKKNRNTGGFMNHCSRYFSNYNFMYNNNNNNNNDNDDFFVDTLPEPKDDFPRHKGSVVDLDLINNVKCQIELERIKAGTFVRTVEKLKKPENIFDFDENEIVIEKVKPIINFKLKI